MSEGHKRVRVVSHDDSGRVVEKQVDIAEGDTIGSLCARAFPDTQEHTAWAPVASHAKPIPIDDIANKGGCMRTDDDGGYVFMKVRILARHEDVELRVHPALLEEVAADGDGFLTVNLGGKTIASYRVTETPFAQGD